MFGPNKFYYKWWVFLRWCHKILIALGFFSVMHFIIPSKLTVACVKDLMNGVFKSINHKKLFFTIEKVLHIVTPAG